MSCLCKLTEHIMCVSDFAELTDVFFMKTYKWCLVSFSNFVRVLINW